ncbi:putative flippase GtrA [Salana multivorans]|uniref:Putative flippase GtrA n=1 Tax=Salana multivorans TaxID=120377 RepID=A0A3N2D7K7_9MICO|nr:GtrA family protein [Salana multivorans]ROR95769.1 putative flippase GtrA [Salana multivorans]
MSMTTDAGPEIPLEPVEPAGSPRAPQRRRRRIGLLLRQAVMFGLVGGAGVVVNMAVAIGLNALNGGPANAQQILFPIPGTDFNVRFTSLVWIVAFLVANLFNFQLNRSWTFREIGPDAPLAGAWWSEFWRFLLVGSVAAFVGLFIKIALTNPSSPIYLPSPWFHEDMGLHSREYWAQLITIVVTMPINFLVNKFWTFRRGGPAA